MYQKDKNLWYFFAKSETDNLGVFRRKKQQQAGNGANYDNYLFKEKEEDLLEVKNLFGRLILNLEDSSYFWWIMDEFNCRNISVNCWH